GAAAAAGGIKRQPGLPGKGEGYAGGVCRGGRAPWPLCGELWAVAAAPGAAGAAGVHRGRGCCGAASGGGGAGGVRGQQDGGAAAPGTGGGTAADPGGDAAAPAGDAAAGHLCG